LVCLTA